GEGRAAGNSVPRARRMPATHRSVGATHRQMRGPSPPAGTPQGGSAPRRYRGWEAGSPSGRQVRIVSDEPSAMRRYGVALLATGGAYWASLVLWPLIDPNAFALFCAAVMVSSWYGGLGPGLLTT